ncbi:L-histidine N(alpha)-methyltransferase [Proteobacteria bacterium 005FR1]|nr:L-histidine N(alpha)-methyltransferase [Proteobacteria bacterium 005FR1]
MAGASNIGAASVQRLFEPKNFNQLSAGQGADSSRSEPSSDFLADVIAGLTQAPKQLQPKYFYDRQGSEYFDQICGLEEYYPFQCELELLPTVAQGLSEVLDREYAMVEFGAGSLRKVQPLLETISGIRSFTPIDISGEHLHAACGELQKQFPELQVQPVVGDFTQPVQLAPTSLDSLGFFPGSTIGNFSPADAHTFLVNAGKTLGSKSYMVIGVDTKKSPELLHSAYNDPHDVTAKFNLNILERINRELDGDIAVDRFKHYAFYNPARGRVEMHLISTADQVAHVAGQPVRFREGESIHTENSYKYTADEFTKLARNAGWKMEKQWFADDDMFATYLIRYEP